MLPSIKISSRIKFLYTFHNDVTDLNAFKSSGVAAPRNQLKTSEFAPDAFANPVVDHHSYSRDQAKANTFSEISTRLVN